MSQGEVLEALEKAPKGLTVPQLAQRIGLMKGSVSTSLRKLTKEGLVTAITYKRDHSIKYKYFIVPEKEDDKQKKSR